MRRLVAELAAVTALATMIAVIIAAPVLQAPSERIFGAEIVGRHHDPFTVMQQFERPSRIGAYFQPVTDIAGAVLARVSGAVAAYNWLVLLSFPFTAAAAYLLARHLSLSRIAATVVALAVAFSPFHLAHAAYHPHIAQTQWLPLYLLALWRCVDNPSPSAIGALGVAAVTVTLSNFYGGFTAAVITPVALIAYSLATPPVQPPRQSRRVLTAASLLFVAAAGLSYVWYVASPFLADGASFAFQRGDLFRYSAKWWSYLVPPIENPLFGTAALELWKAAGVSQGLLEQQVDLGWGIIGLCLVAVFSWGLAARRTASRALIPVLVAVAVAALLCSLSPERTIGTFHFVRPSAFLYDIAPMFRSYARFGVVVQLMAALLAGMGVDQLRQFGTRRATTAGVALVALVIAEYAVSPSAMWRDVLPTRAHRWVMSQPGHVQALDCVPLTAESASVPWLTGDRTRVLGGPIEDCNEPNLPDALAANGYTHVLIRQGTTAHHAIDRASPDGLRSVARFDDGEVFAVTARAPAIYTVAMSDFSPRERDAERSWRWMGADGTWLIANTRPHPIVAAVDVEMSAFHRPRRVQLLLDGQTVQTMEVEPLRRVRQIGPLTISPGSHTLTFYPIEAPTVASDVIDSTDHRPLSLALGRWVWTVWGEQP